MLTTKMAVMTRQTAHRLRNALLVVTVLDALLILGRLWSYSAFFDQPNSIQYVLEPLIVLLIYAGIVVAYTASPALARQTVLRQAVVFGVITGVMEVINIALETFAHLSGPVNILATAPFLLGSFVLWGVSAFHVVRQTGSLRYGVSAAISSAMIGILIGIAFGFLLMYTSLPMLAQNINGSPEHIASHWTDLRAFAIANTLDAGFTHLVGAWIVGSVVGTVGGLLGRQFSGQANFPVSPKSVQ